ncbi:hypothetical protein FJY94_07290 [Candidatus Kaiserbacteria bacterium]|nr:hypothetical protein [Candidatus Kaiserbacteria bacterium]
MKKTTINTNHFHPIAAAVAAGLLALVPPHAYAQTKPAPAPAPASAAVTGPEPLAKFLRPLIKSDRRIAAAAEDMAAAEQKSSAASGDWFPTLKVTSWAGDKERIDNPGATADTALRPKQTDVTITQLMADFGKTDSKVRRAQIAAQQSDVSYQLITQTLINDAASAYANLYRASIQLKYANESFDNLAKQLQLEQARLKAGGGVAADVLQVQAQLSAAQARRIRASSQVQVANSRFFNLFGSTVANLENLVRPAAPTNLPVTLEAAIQQAQETNLTIKNAVLSTQSARESIRGDRAESYFPKFEAIYDHKNKDNVLGTAGVKKESLLKVQMTWSFNLGGAGIHTVRAAEHSAAAAGYRQTDAEKNAREQVSTAWQGLMTARQTAIAYAGQVEAVSKFLQLARKERTLGSRSLIDVLNGETSLINAQSDALSAQIDEILAGYLVLQSLGQLSEAVVTRH